MLITKFVLKKNLQFWIFIIIHPSDLKFFFFKYDYFLLQIFNIRWKSIKNKGYNVECFDIYFIFLNGLGYINI